MSREQSDRPTIEEVDSHKTSQEEHMQQQSKDQKIETPKHAFDHGKFGIYADSVLQKESECGAGITLRVTESKYRKTSLMKYVVYHIVGEDKKGQIDAFRRFNEFYKMRVALVSHYPGCFIPSIPDKSISIVDDQIVHKRQRYLNDFIKKITRLPHLYNSQEFQALLRSMEKDLSQTFEKWPNPTTSDINNKYKQHFGELAGKAITNEVRVKINDFQQLINSTQKSMLPFKNMVKELALARDSFDKHLPLMFSNLLPSYQKECLVECIKSEAELISANQSEAKFLEHEAVARQSFKQNPYWLLYDLIKHEERDGKAFLEAIKAVETYRNKKYELSVKISQNCKAVGELISAKKGNSQEKYKLEVENQKNQKQKQGMDCLTDIIIALVSYIEIERFKSQKSQFYEIFLRKMGGFEIHMVQNLIQIWKDWNKKTYQYMQRYNDR